MEEENELVCKLHCGSVLEQLANFRRSDSMCDVTLRAEDLSIKAHKLILSANSIYFRTMFAGNWPESQSSEVVLHGLTAKGLQAVVDFVYSGRLQLDLESVADVLAALHHCFIVDSYDQCQRFLINTLTTDSNFSDLFELSGLFGLKKVQETLVEFVVENVMPSKCATGRDFLDPRVYELQPDLLMQVLAKWNHSKVGLGKFATLELLVKWADRSDTDRKKHLSKMFSGILKRDVGEAEVDEVVTNSRLTHEERKQLPKTLHALGTVSARYRLEWPVYEMASNTYTTESAIPAIPITSNHLLTVTQMTVLKGVLYVSACHNNNYHDEDGPETKRFYKYDPWLNYWVLLQPMQEPRKDFPLVCLNGELIAAGGHENRDYKPLRTVEIYNPMANTWSSGPSLPWELVNHAGASYAGKVYISGGQAMSTSQIMMNKDELLCYDPKKGSWSEKQKMPISCSGHQLIAHNYHLYQFGGRFDERRLLDCYSIPNDTWTVVTKNTCVFSGLDSKVQLNIAIVAGYIDYGNVFHILYDSQPSAKCRTCMASERNNKKECEICDCRTSHSALFDVEIREVTDIGVMARKTSSHIKNSVSCQKCLRVVVLDMPLFVTKYV